MPPTGSELIDPAKLDWPEGRPYNPVFKDVYYSEDAEGEVHRVFLDPVYFGDRCVNQPAGRSLRIAETGFGTALNFLVAAEQALAAGCDLDFFSCEAAPLRHHDAARVFDTRTATNLSRALIRDWPPLLTGWHRRVLADGKIRLSVFHGDVVDFLAELQSQLIGGIDHWLLDGFTPDRNPSMWSEEVIAKVASLTATQGTLATFTAKGQIRRALERNGFELERISQKPYKHESVIGHFRPVREQRLEVESVQVIGAGFAGAWIARSLAERNVGVQVIEQSSVLGAGASGLPAAAQHGRLLADGSAAARLRASASTFAAARTRGWPGIETVGALQGPGPTADADRLARIAQRYEGSGAWLRSLSPTDASERANIAISDPRLWFEDAAVVRGPRLVSALLDHPRIELVLGRSGAIRENQATVVASGAEVTEFDPMAFLEVLGVSGQLDVFRVDASPTCLLLADGYMAPLGNGEVAVGSTYEYQPWRPDEASTANRERLASFGVAAAERSRESFRAERAVSSDRTPIVGRVESTVFEQLWVCTGLGSLGTTFAPLAGEVIASQILGEPAPVAVDLLAALAPERFKARQARRGLRHGARALTSD